MKFDMVTYFIIDLILFVSHKLMALKFEGFDGWY